jgi:putative ABC transport system ATP-binding protein
MALIEVNNLSKTYHSEAVETPALQGLTFEIKKGEFVAIMGPSGCGKSTLLHILGFLDENTGGTYRFEGKTMQEYSKENLARVRNQKMGFIFQAFNLLPRTTILDNTKLPLLYSDIKESEWTGLATKALESVGLGHRLNFEPAQLSGGEKQRAAIARALINDPEIIFADEPTGNLDSKSGQIVMELLQQLNEKHGHTIILITHETYTAEHAERIIRLKDGKLESDTQVGSRRKADNDFIK